MEIERRFMVSAFPEQIPVQTAIMVQSYIGLTPETRIRATEIAGTWHYELTFKSEGTLVREEVEMPLTKEKYEALLKFVKGAPIIKDYRVYDLKGYKLEVCEVDQGTPDAFFYAEIEFETEEDAHAFDAAQIPYYLEEVTEAISFNMVNYWKRTRGVNEPVKSR